MTTLNISLPDDLKIFVEAQAAAQGFGTVSEYMQTLIREAQERTARREEVEAQLLDGLDSGPATPFDEADWAAIRHEVNQRHSSRQSRTYGPKDA